jgi:rhodanese-related sulfurtransferase
LLPNAIPDWLALPQDVALVFFCRSGTRSAQAARALRRLGHSQSWSLAGGLALLPGPSPDMARGPNEVEAR